MGENIDCKCDALASECVYTGERHHLPLMSPSGLVTLDLCVVSGTGHLDVRYRVLVLFSLPGPYPSPCTALAGCSSSLCWGVPSMINSPPSDTALSLFVLWEDFLSCTINYKLVSGT